jgi:hypothetical protein
MLHVTGKDFSGLSRDLKIRPGFDVFQGATRPNFQISDLLINEH